MEAQIQHILGVAMTGAKLAAKWTATDVDDRLVAILAPALTSPEFAKFLAHVVEGKGLDKAISTADLLLALYAGALAQAAPAVAA